MPDAHEAALERSENTQTTGSSTTPEFDAALVDAGRLLEHAASNGLLPEGRAGTTQPAEALIHDLV